MSPVPAHLRQPVSLLHSVKETTLAVLRIPLHKPQDEDRKAADEFRRSRCYHLSREQQRARLYRLTEEAPHVSPRRMAHASRSGD